MEEIFGKVLPVINIFEQPLSVTHVASFISNALLVSNQGFTKTAKFHSIEEVFSQKIFLLSIVCTLRFPVVLTINLLLL